MASNITNDFNLPIDIFNKIIDILYFLSPTEQHGRLNSFYQFLANITIKDIKNIISIDNIKKYSLTGIYRTICLYYDDLTLLKSYINAVEELKNNDYYFMILGYYITYQNLYNLKIKVSDINTDNIKLKNDKLHSIYNYLKSVYIEYFQKIVSVMNKQFDEVGLTEQIYDMQFN